MNIKVCEKLFDINFVNTSFNNMNNVENQIKIIDNKQAITAIIICLEDKTKAIKFGMDLILMLEFERIPVKLHFPIRVYLEKNEDVFKLPKSYPISPFGLLRNTCSQEVVMNEILDKLAKLIHEHYKLKQEQKGLTKKDNPYLVEWHELPPDIKDSNRQQADHIPIKLRALNLNVIKKNGKKGKPFEGFTEAEIEKLARMEHNRWCAERWISEWKYSEVKDTKNKLFPLLKPYDNLAEEDKQIDLEFIRNIPNLLNQLNLQLIKGD